MKWNCPSVKVGKYTFKFPVEMVLFSIVYCLIVSALGMPYRVPLQGMVGQKNTLVIMDRLHDKSKYSMFFDELMDRKHLLTFIQADDKNLVLETYGDFIYGNIILFAPLTEHFGGVKLSDLIAFMEQGGNLLMAVDDTMSDTMRDLTEHFGIVMDEQGVEVLDHFSHEDGLDDRYLLQLYIGLCIIPCIYIAISCCVL